jgi:hypothetical protein
MAQQSLPKFPNNSQRTVVVGRTGTGKTVAACWHLSNYDMEKPWVMFNFKGDEHLESIKEAKDISLDYVPGKKDKGLFIVTPTPYDLEGTNKERSNVDKFLMKLWERENIGIFIDECFMVGNSPALVLNLTQGRSKRIPMILCTQRPVWITRFAFSEASFIQVFDLNDDRDISTVESFVPIDWDEESRLKEHCSYYYDIARNEVFRFAPVPDMDAILARLTEKLSRQRVRI